MDVFPDRKSFQYVYTQGELNLRQLKSLMFLKDYDMNVHNHQGKTNVVADALCRISMVSTAHVEDGKKELVKYIHRLSTLDVPLVYSTSGGISVHLSSESSFVVEVKEGDHFDRVLIKLKDSVLVNLNECLALGDDGILREDTLCVPDVDDLRNRIIVETHVSRYSIHPG